MPVLGPWVVDLLLGGPVIGGDSLSRFFALHVFVIPGAAAALPGRPPLAGAQARDQRAARPRAKWSIRKTYDDASTRRSSKRGVPFLGDAMLKDALFSALAVIVVVVLAAVARAERARPARPTRRWPAPIPGRSGRSSGSSPCCRSARPGPRRSSSWSSRSS